MVEVTTHLSLWMCPNCENQARQESDSRHELSVLFCPDCDVRMECDELDPRVEDVVWSDLDSRLFMLEGCGAGR